MDLTPKLREHTDEIIIDFIRSKVADAQARGVVLGLSGGVDSAVTAKLCALALGPKNVFCLLLPEKEDEIVKDALRFAKSLKVNHKVIVIYPVIETISSILKIEDSAVNRIMLGNIKARVRMLLLYAFANQNNCLVMGTSNKSELLVGYYTKFGDGAADYAPLGDLYKTQVWELAKKLGIPKEIAEKIPTAGLWPGQSDEEELGIAYHDMDRILHGIELGYSDETIAECLSIDTSEVQRMRNMIERSVHKRRLALIPKLGVRTVGIDWRE